MMYRYQSNRPAIAMIELIFSIVVIGITLMSAPMLMQQASKSGYVAIQQEGINEAASRISMIMDYHWDEANTDISILDRVLLTGTDVAELREAIGTDGNGTGWGIGTPIESYRNYIDSDGNKLTAVAPDAIGLDIAEVAHTSEDDIDDFGAATLVLVQASDIDYIEKAGEVSMATTVNYMSDVPDGGSYDTSTLTFDPNFDDVIDDRSTNIKRITVTLTSKSAVDELEKTITFNAFSCNIGGFELEERTF